MRLLKYIARWFTPEVKLIILLFVTWRIWTTVFAMLAIEFVPLRSIHLLGGSFSNYITNPLFWAWANFDGEHYLAIAEHGYEKLTHAFFPVYPLLMRFFALLFGEGLKSLLTSGLLISNIFFLFSLFFLWKLVRLDYSVKIAQLTLLSLVLFPTSFYFGSVYTEALFLFLVLASFYCARRQRWFMSGILGTVASATRVFGILLLPALFMEWLQQKKEGGLVAPKRNTFFELLAIFSVSLGLLGYMLFLYKTTGNPLSFYTEQAVFAQERVSDKIILLPQVFWRYAKMLATVDRLNPFYSGGTNFVYSAGTSFAYFTIWTEVLTGIGVIALLFWGYIKKMRLSYLTFAFLGYILPTLTGTFTSMPRYVLVLFPLFILIGILLSQKNLKKILVVLSVAILLLIIETALFVRGYWVG